MRVKETQLRFSAIECKVEPIARLRLTGLDVTNVFPPNTHCDDRRDGGVAAFGRRLGAAR